MDSAGKTTFSGVYFQARYCLEACAELLKDKDWEGARVAALSYHETLPPLLESARNEITDHPERGEQIVKSLLELDKRQRKIMGKLSQHMLLVTEEELSLKKTKAFIKSQQNLIATQ